MKRSSVLLGIVPVLWMILAWITISAGGRFSLFDPDYYYLLSSLDLATLRSIGLFHHPGTTAEIFGAGVILIVHLFQHTPDDVQTAVLKDPESFMAAIHVLSALLNGLALLALGIVSFKVTKNVWLSILLQLSPFVSSLILIDTLGRFKAEPFILFACLLFLALVVVFVYSEKTDGNGLALAFAGVCGFGLATKFTFAPVLVIPVLLLRGAKQKALFLAGTALATVAFTLPIANRYAEFARWMSDVAFHNGLYGVGSAGIVDVNVYTKNFAALLSSNALFVAIVLFAVFVMILTILGDYQSGARRTSRPAFKALSAIVLSQVIGFALVAKYYFDLGNSRYLFTSYCLLGLTFILSVTHFLSSEYRLQKIPRYIALAILAVGILLNRDDIPKQLSKNIRARRLYRNLFAAFESKKTFLGGEDFKDYARIVDEGVRTVENGLFQAASFSVSHQEALQRIYANTYFCPVQCTPGNWKAKTMTGFDLGKDSKPWSADALIARHRGKKIVLFYTAGSAPAIYVVGEPLKVASGAIPTAAFNAERHESESVADQEHARRARAPRGDVNADGSSDLMWRNKVTGQNIQWQMNGTLVALAVVLATSADPTWQIVADEDLNGDGKADLFWRNKATGDNIVWLMDGRSIVSAVVTTPNPDLNWEVKAYGDFNGDGKGDLFWRNKVTGGNAIWLMNGAAVLAADFLPTIASKDWDVKGAGDFDGDGRADIFWRNSVSGQNIVWLMNGLMRTSSTRLPTIADVNWDVKGVGDFDGDGKADIVWRNGATGQSLVWLMHGTTVGKASSVATIADLNWEIKAIADIDRDGRADVIWRNKVTGQNTAWLMNGTTISSRVLATIADTNWELVGPR